MAFMAHRFCLALPKRSYACGMLVAASPVQENFPCLPPNAGEHELQTSGQERQQAGFSGISAAPGDNKLSQDLWT